MHAGRTILALLAACISIQLHAEVRLSESRVWRRARPLSIGQQVWAFQTSYQDYSDRFTSHGTVEGLGDRHSRGVTWKQLLDGYPEARAEIRQMMKGRYSENDVAALATYNMRRQENGFAVDWAYGLTNTWSIGFQVPLVYRQTRVTTSVQMAPALEERSNQKGQQTVSALQNGNLHGKVSEMARTELSNSGFDAIPDQRASWDWGDIELMSQVALAQSFSWAWALQQTVSVPTARNPNVSDFLQTGGDDGQVDLGVTSLLDYRQRGWLAGLRTGYVAQLPDTLRMRVPTSSRLSVDPSVRRDLGDWVWAALDTEWDLSRRVQFTLEYSYLTKGQDRYSSASETGVNYDALGEDTQQELHQARVGFLYRVGTRSSRSGVESKTVASVGYTYPMIGKNSVDASRATLELISYF